MKTKSILLGALLIASSAHADINGMWNGTIAESGSDGSTFSAPGFMLGISTAAGAISFCEPMGYTFLDGLTFTVQGSNLMLNNHLAGSIGTSADGTTLNLVLSDDIDGLFDDITLTVNLDGSLTYADYFADFYGDYINSTSIAQACSEQPTGKHAVRGSVLRANFNNLKKKPQHLQ